MSGNQSIRTSRRARAALLLIGVVLVSLVPMAPANAAASITISRGSVIGGESITVKGSIGMKKARQVVLQRQSGAKWIAVISSRSTTAGAYKFTYKPPTKSPSKTVIRVIAPRVTISGKTYPQITSGGRSVLTVGQGATISMPATTPRDEPFNVTGTFTPARTGRAVVLQKPASTSGWVSVGTATAQNSLGKVSVPMTLKVQGTYTFRLLTLAAGGAAAVASQPLTIEVKAPLGAPAAPTGLQAQAGNAKVDLSWNAVSAPDLAGYAIYRRTSTLEQWGNPLTTVSAGTTSKTVEPLTNGQSYQFAVTAFDTDGNESDKSTAASATPSAPVDNTPPAVPTGLDAEPGNGSVQLTWNAVAPEGLAGYHVYRATNAAGPWTKLTTNTTATTSYNASGLTNGTQYFFAVTSVDNSPAANESAKSNVASATPAQAADTTPPPVPTGAGAVAGNASATVSWNGVAAGDLDGYMVYRGTSASGPWTDPVTVDKALTSTVVNGLTNGTTYYFAVTSFDVSDNESDKSSATSGVVPQAGANVWSSVSAGADHTCAIRSDGSLWCWGRNTHGQLGGAGSIVNQPTRVGNLNTWNGVSAGDRFTCATKTDGTLWCWGRDKYGQTGSTANLDSEGFNSVPTQLGSATTWTKVSAGDNSACGLQGGTLWCWGWNLDGQLGKAANANVDTPNPTPAQVGAVTTWESVSAGSAHACATRADDSLWCWGSNLSGQLGTATNSGTFTPTTTPVQVAGAWTNVSAGGGHTCAVNSLAKIYCWGENSYGELGKGANAGANPTPAKITDHSWATVSAGTAHTCAVTTTGQAWCWGHNQRGQVGKAANDVNPEPSQVAGTTWSTIDAGGDHTAATTTSGTILTWGSNEFGQLGTATNSQTTNPNPTPVQVPVP